MRILVINPNTTVAMTEQIGRAACAAATPGTEIVAVNPPDGPVQSKAIMTRRSRCRDYWPKSPKATPPGFPHIACFDDTGLEAARR